MQADQVFTDVNAFTVVLRELHIHRRGRVVSGRSALFVPAGTENIQHFVGRHGPLFPLPQQIIDLALRCWLWTRRLLKGGDSPLSRATAPCTNPPIPKFWTGIGERRKRPQIGPFAYRVLTLAT